MAQMLVALRVVRDATAGQVSHPADALDEIRERFLPALWGARRLWLDCAAAYVRQEGPEQHHQHGLHLLERRRADPELQGPAPEHAGAQVELAGLFLLHEEKAREEVVPCLALHELQDDPTNNTRGWYFL
ncbi:hypothetical protein BJX65DRAFT_315246 [Aspergillus insuetus]